MASQECVEQAKAENDTNLELGLYEGRVGAPGNFQRIVHRIFGQRFPDFHLNQVCSQYNSLVQLGQIECPEPEKTCLPPDNIQAVMDLWERSFKYSQRPLYDAVCYNCSELLYRTAGSHHPCALYLQLPAGSDIPIERHFPQEFLRVCEVPYRDAVGRYCICPRCNKDKASGKMSPLDIFAVSPTPDQQCLPIPEVED